MPGINLKHYDKYLQALELYATSTGIKIQYSDVDGEGAYIPARRKIRLDPDLSQSMEIAVLLHELGHALDGALVDKKQEQKIERAYAAMDQKRARAYQREIVLACETRAWEYGRSIAKKLRIRLGKWFTEAQNYCLDTYKSL